MIIIIYAELEINFDLEGCDYSRIDEGSRTLDAPIRLKFRRNQESFAVTFTALSVYSVEGIGLGDFIDSVDIANATAS